MNIQDKIAELKNDIQAFKSKADLKRWEQSELEEGARELQGIEELIGLGFTVEHVDYHDYRVDNTINIRFNGYGSKDKYQFLVCGTNSPNKITIGKATQKKVQAWIDYAIEQNKLKAEKDQAIADKKQESLNKLEELEKQGLIVDREYKEIKSMFFRMRYEILDDGNLSFSPMAIINYGSDLDLLIKLQKGGF